MTDKDNNTSEPERLRPFRVGEWQVLPEFNELRGRDGAARVQPRLIQVLRLLAQNAGRTVTREALIEGAWSRRMVNDEVLSRTIADLRQALGDDARQPRYLETIPKLGYRLIAEVEWLQVAARVAPPAVASVPAVTTIREEPPVPAQPPATSGGMPAMPDRRWNRVWAAGVVAALVIAAVVYWGESGRPLPTDPTLPVRVLRAQPLTSDPGWELSPRFAHHADLIAYSDSAPGQGFATVRLRSRDGRVLRAFTDGSSYDICPTFSPDDRELLWTRHGEDGCEILRAPLLGGAPAPVATCATGVLSCPDWSADWLVYSAPPTGPDRAAGLTRMRLSDGRREVLTSPALGDGNDTHPRIAADGRIAFGRGAEGDRSLMLWQSATGEQRIDVAPGMVYGQDWLPDGRLLTATDALGFRALVALDPISGAAELLGARGARYPDVAADGALVYEHASYDANLWLQAGDTAEPRQLTQSVRYDAYPRLTPDGSRVVYQTNRDGPESLYLLDLASGTETRLPLDPTMRWAQPAWSADGQRLTLTRYAGASGDIGAARVPTSLVDLWVYVLGSDAPTRLANAPVHAHDAQFDPDGEHAWARVGQERVARLVRFRLDGSAALLTRAEIVEHYQIDRQGLFLVQDGDPRLFRCADPEALACTALPLTLSPAHRRNWAIADGAVYAVTDGDDGAKVIRFDLASGEQRRLSWPVPGALSRALDVDRKERFAIIARTDRVDVDLHWVAPREQ